LTNWSTVKSALDTVNKEYSLVLVDAGHAYGEATMKIARICDRILLHVRLGKTHRELARNVADLYFSNNLTVSGVIVTNVTAATA
jgi:Mrp family chromosome partitioning ATPase